MRHRLQTDVDVAEIDLWWQSSKVSKSTAIKMNYHTLTDTASFRDVVRKIMRVLDPHGVDARRVHRFRRRQYRSKVTYVRGNGHK